MISSSLCRRHSNGAQDSQSALVDLQAQIYRETREVSRPISQLMTWFLDRRNLAAAWDRVRHADGSNTPGVDGVTCNELHGQAIPWLAKLADDLLHERYRPQVPRWVDVPKSGNSGATRRLGILSIRDRVVHAALKQILDPILEPGFWSFSFGFRPGRSVPGALAEAVRLLSPSRGEASPPFEVAVHVDIASCFDTIDHELLFAELTKHVSDAALLQLIKKILQPGSMTVRRFFRRRTVAVIQGSALSPLLCNLYLHPLDQGLCELEQSSQHLIRALRYADDLLLLAQNENLARRAVACTSRLLAARRQRLRDPYVTPSSVRDGVNWLGVRLLARACRWSDQTAFGYVVPDGKVTDMLGRLTEMTTPPSDRIDASAFNPEGWIMSLNEQLQDWYHAYRFADNAMEVFRAVDGHTRERVTLLLQSLTGIRRNEVFDRYRQRMPRGFWSWGVNGTRLVLLSALAPHCPAHLTRRPLWMRHTPKPTGSNGKTKAPSRALTTGNGLPALSSPVHKEDS